ncbi:MAG: hypothetical protein JXB62_10015 [Pirellulales bacterium]|nr:hypothetical protein [Pirellulales bacterium]
MTGRWLLISAFSVTVLAGASRLPAAEETTPAKTAQAWTFDEAMTQMRLNPDDAYLQYVALQLGRNQGKTDQVYGEIQDANRRRRRGWRSDRPVDLFAMFTGALAVQEALQLDTMRIDDTQLRKEPAGLREEKTPLADLAGPTIKSHPWGKMLAAQRVAGNTPQVSPLAMCVPEDQYFLLFRSLTKLLEGVDVADLWGAHLFSQGAKSAKTQQTSLRLKQQLAMETDLLTRPFYDMVVDEVAITGNDLYFREGSDVTVLFSVKQPDVFRARMDGFLQSAEQSRRDTVRSTGTISGVEYVQVATPDRAIHVFSAYPKPTLHVRSNSKAALQRVLEAIAGQGDVGRLGEATEFKYIRTLMARGDQKEDGFVYLSDPFIRRLVGPQVKLTERRRMVCYNHLRMIGHAAMLYRTQFGKAPQSLEALAESDCAPCVFGSEGLRCPCGGQYELSKDGTTGVCSHHGHTAQLVPCLEIPLKRVTDAEAKQYRQFVESYSRYWRRFFDPIAIRVQLTPGSYRAETIVLPMIDNTVYSGLAATLGGEPEPLDALPVPKRNVFSMALRLNKQPLLQSRQPVLEILSGFHRAKIEVPPGGVTIEEFLAKGIGNQIGMHVYDASPFFDFNLTGFLGEVVGSFSGGGGFNDEMIPISFLIASLNAPVYVAVPVEDAPIVDQFLDQLDGMLAALARQPARGGWFNLDYDFYRVPLKGQDDRIRCYAVQFGPIKWRVFFARLGDGLYLASKRFILEDLAAIEAKQADTGPVAHAMIRIRPEHWKDVLPAFRLGWAESSRTACLNNLGPLSSVARAMRASDGDGVKPAEIHGRADALHAVHFFCPDGGKYAVSPDGKQVTCSVHGSAIAPRQLAAPAPRSPMGRLMKDFGGATAELTFLEDGLHAVVTIDRK